MIAQFPLFLGGIESNRHTGRCWEKLGVGLNAFCDGFADILYGQFKFQDCLFAVNEEQTIYWGSLNRKPRTFRDLRLTARLFKLCLKNESRPKSRYSDSDGQGNQYPVSSLRPLAWSILSATEPIPNENENLGWGWWSVFLGGFCLVEIGGLVVWRAAHSIDDGMPIRIGVVFIILGLVFVGLGAAMLRHAFLQINSYNGGIVLADVTGLDHCGFFPTPIRTALEGPCCISTFLPTLSSCGGNVLEERFAFSAIAALTYAGISPRVRARRDAVGCSESMDTITAFFKQSGTAKSTSLPKTLIAGKPPGGLTLFHPVRCRRPSIAPRNCMDSSSSKTQENVYSVPVNNSKEAIISGIWTSDLGVFNVSNSSRACAIFSSAMACSLLEETKIPASEKDSMVTPTITSHLNAFSCLRNRLVFVHSDASSLGSGFLYSPAIPTASNMPNTNSAISEAWKSSAACDSERERRYPIPLYDLAAALGIVLKGVCLAILLYRRLK